MAGARHHGLIRRERLLRGGRPPSDQQSPPPWWTAAGHVRPRFIRPGPPRRRTGRIASWAALPREGLKTQVRGGKGDAAVPAAERAAAGPRDPGEGGRARETASACSGKPRSPRGPRSPCASCVRTRADPHRTSFVVVARALPLCAGRGSTSCGMTEKPAATRRGGRSLKEHDGSQPGAAHLSARVRPEIRRALVHEADRTGRTASQATASLLAAVACVAETRDLACASGLRWLIRYVRRSRAGRQSRTRPHRVAALHAGVVQFARRFMPAPSVAQAEEARFRIPFAELRRRLPRLAVAVGEPALCPRRGVHRHGTGADQRYAAQYARLVARLPAIARRRARRSKPPCWSDTWPSRSPSSHGAMQPGPRRSAAILPPPCSAWISARRRQAQARFGFPSPPHGSSPMRAPAHAHSTNLGGGR